MKIAGVEFPDGLLYLVEHDVWARLGDDTCATVGITALGAELSGEVYMCRAKPPGARIAQGGAVAVVELAKAIVSVRSPVSGTVVEVNPLLAQRPELVYADPYGDGWIVRLRLDDLEADRARLVTGPAAADEITRHAQQMRRPA